MFSTVTAYRWLRPSTFDLPMRRQQRTTLHAPGSNRTVGSSMRWSPVFALIWALTGPGTPGGATAREPATQPDAPDARTRLPAEEIRFHTGVFRAALKKRGLTGLLDLHLRDFPPADEVDKLLMTREIKLAEFADARRPLHERRTSVAGANRILEQLIAGNADHPLRLDWQFALAHSLLYDEAEPFFTGILYRGGSATDRARLGAYTGRAAAVVTTLLGELGEELERIDQLSVPKFEALERTGYIDKLDRLAPQTQYLRLWALFYDCLWRESSDSTRLRKLNEILFAFSESPAFVETPHVDSGVQVQCLLLAGMSYRRLDDHVRARDYLDRTVRVGQRLKDPDQQQRIGWAITLARIERIRNDRDDGRFTQALDGVNQFHDALPAQEGGGFSFLLAAALLERSVHRARAAAAERAGRDAEAVVCRAQAWQSLARLARSEPERRDKIYAALFDLVGPDADPAKLDPLEQCALMAGLLSRAEHKDADEGAMLDRAIKVGERFVVDAGRAAPSLVPEVLYNLAVARYLLGELTEAAEGFIRVAKDHPSFNLAHTAAALAVQICAKLDADRGSEDRQRLRPLYRHALELLLTNHSTTKEAAYWRFFYAQLLDELEQLDQAARQYAKVNQAHEHYVESVFSRLRALSRGLHHTAKTDPNDLAALRLRANELIGVQREFTALATSQLVNETSEERTALMKEFLARARLMVAEAQVLPQLDQAARALELLTGFEGKYAASGTLAGRVWRVRLLAYEQLGRLDEAADAVPEYIAADPDRAGPTLQLLYRSMADDVEQLRRKDDVEQARRKVHVALLLAQQIHDWADRFDAVTAPGQRRALTVQLAEANLNAGRYDRARKLFEQLASSESPLLPTGPGDLRIAYGHAESLFKLDLVEQALEKFNRLAIRLPADDPIRWRSLLRDLQCRTALNHPPQEVMKVIDQQRYLYPKLGGPSLASQFEELYRNNRRRLDGG